MKISTAWVLALALVAGAAGTAGGYVNIEQRFNPEQRRATGIDTLSPEQLAALNAILRGEQDVVVESARKDERQKAPAGGTLAGFNDEPIKSRLKGSVASWEPGTVFELENGQSWKVLKGHMRLRKPMEAPDVIVVPGLAGRWFLQVHEDFPKARVYRID